MSESVDTPVEELTDRRLAAAVAEEVMGARFWLERRGDYRMAVWCEPGRMPWDGVRNPDTSRYEDATAREAMRAGFVGRDIPEYHRDISAAWQVVWHVTAYAPNEDAPPPLDFELWKEGGTDVHEARFGTFTARACSAPTAICRAALLATRETEGDEE